MATHIETHHFRTETDAKRYYATYGETLAERRANNRYRVRLFRQNKKARTVHSGLTLAEAEARCSGPDSTGYENGVRWFYGREKE